MKTNYEKYELQLKSNTKKVCDKIRDNYFFKNRNGYYVRNNSVIDAIGLNELLNKIEKEG